MKIYILAFFVLLFTACGGGGGSSLTDFAGQYRVALILAEDSCGVDTAPILDLRHTVNQNGSIIVVNSGSVVLTGETENDGSAFTATNTENDGTCITRTGYRYSDADSAETDYSVAMLITSNCGSGECRVAYVGNARRD